MSDPTGQSIEFYDTEAATYDERRWTTEAGQYIDKVQKNILLELIGDCDGLRVLEIAAGTGRFSLELAKRGAIVTALDSSEKMLNITKEKFKDAGLEEQLSLHKGSATDLPFEKDEFDICVCINAMNHIPGFDIVLSEIGRVLKKEGVSVTNYTNWLSYYFPFGIWANIKKKSITRDVYTKWFRFREIKSAHITADLDIVSVTGAVQFPTATSNSVLLFLLKQLDKLSRTGPLKSVSPMLFVKAKIPIRRPTDIRK
jgi:ubiquinone/menaquinone biosynthesis C-methylase UbiE